MQYEFCATYDAKEMDSVATYAGAASRWPRSGNLSVLLDSGLDWITEKLDRKFVSAMEKSVSDDPVRKKELNMLKRTILVLVSLGLGVTAVSIKFALETQLIYLGLG